MKRATVMVMVTIADDSWGASQSAKKIQTAMVNAGVAKATELDQRIVQIEAKVGTPNTTRRKR